MSGVQDKINKIRESKEAIRNAIIETGGTLPEDTTFRNYPEQIQYIIDTTIIPQSELDILIEKTNSIIGGISNKVKVQLESNGNLLVTDIKGQDIFTKSYNINNELILRLTRAEVTRIPEFPISLNRITIRSYSEITNASSKTLKISSFMLKEAGFNLNETFLVNSPYIGVNHVNDLILAPGETYSFVMNNENGDDINITEEEFLNNWVNTYAIGNNHYQVIYEEVN